MICKKCGKNNPPANNKCCYCNTPLYPQGNNGSNHSEKNIILIIAILLLILLVLVMVYFTGCDSKKDGFGVGGGGGGGSGMMGYYNNGNQNDGSSSESGNGGNNNSGNNNGDNGNSGGDNGSGSGSSGSGSSGSGSSGSGSSGSGSSGSGSSGSGSSGSGSSGSGSSGSGSSGSGSSGSGSSGSGSSGSGSTETENASETQRQKNRFLQRAEEIEIYAEENLHEAMSQIEINNESEIVFKKWDYLLNEIYQYLKTVLPTSEFSALEAEEIEWIKEKEAAMQQAREDWEGGSGMTMAVNMVGIDYTMSRCYYLIDLIPADE